MTLNEIAYIKIKEGVFSGEYKWGATYSAQYLGEKLKMSRTPVRDAVLRLAEENLVEILPNRGCRIRKMDATLLGEISQIRCMVDGYCASYLAANIKSKEALVTIYKLNKITQEQIKVLHSTTEDTYEINARWYDLDAQFHNVIINFANNQYIKDIIQDINAYIKYIGLLTADMKDRKQESMNENQEIIKGIRSGDSFLAYANAQEHATKIFKRMLDYIGRDEGK